MPSATTSPNEHPAGTHKPGRVFLMYLIAILFPPIAIACKGKIFQAILNVLMGIFLWPLSIPLCMIHAICVVAAANQKPVMFAATGTLELQPIKTKPNVHTGCLIFAALVGLTVLIPMFPRKNKNHQEAVTKTELAQPSPTATASPRPTLIDY
jgi:uncharacterized membrane protein YqaE (UPF0057 family)